MTSLVWQALQIFLCVALAPLLLGFVRWIKSRLLGKRGAPILQPYRDVLRLIKKEAIVAHNASWLFRVAPYLIFAFVWLAAAMVPTFSTNLFLVPAADLIGIVALLGASRFLTALAGMDIGTSFGGLGSSREMMIASLAEPAMLMTVFTISLVAGTTSPAQVVHFVLAGNVGLEVSLGLALVALIMVAIAENGRIPIDNPATHLELTMVHEAMVLEYSGRHLALIDLAAMVRLQMYLSLILCMFIPWGITQSGGGPVGIAIGLTTYVVKLFLGGAALAVFETSIAKMRVFRVADFLGGALLLAVLATIFLYVSEAV